MQEHPIILFDGVCNFCNSTVTFIINQDKKKIFQFASLQSLKGQEILHKFGEDETDLNSFILFQNQQIYKKSSAALKLYSQLPWYWKWTQIFWIVPKFLRDGVYDIIAKNRYRWFGKKDECMIPTPEMKSRFL